MSKFHRHDKQYFVTRWLSEDVQTVYLLKLQIISLPAKARRQVSHILN